MERRDRFIGIFRCEECRREWKNIIHDYEYSVLERCPDCHATCCAKYVSEYLMEQLNKINFPKMCTNFLSGMVKTTSDSITIWMHQTEAIEIFIFGFELQRCLCRNYIRQIMSLSL